MVKKRSITLSVTKTLSGDIAEGYPRTYYGMQAFSFSGTEYPTITEEQLARLGVSVYEARLAAFIGYVESQESGLDVSVVQTNEPYF